MVLKKVIHVFSLFDLYVQQLDAMLALMVVSIYRIPPLIEIIFQLCLTTLVAGFVGAVLTAVFAACASLFKILTCEYLKPIFNSVVHYLQKGSCNSARTVKAVIRMMMACMP